jgi:hypothetical protein
LGAHFHERGISLAVVEPLHGDIADETAGVGGERRRGASG